jgi:hypothetical protein
LLPTRLTPPPHTKKKKRKKRREEKRKNNPKPSFKLGEKLSLFVGVCNFKKMQFKNSDFKNYNLKTQLLTQLNV